MHNKALLAIAFAGGMLNSQLPALSEESKSQSTDSEIQQIERTTTATPELLAFYLLRLASSYIEGGDSSAAEARYVEELNNASNGAILSVTNRWGNVLVNWAEQLSAEARSKNQVVNQKKGKPNLPLKTDATSVRANAALQKAVAQLEKSTDPFAKLNMYFIASLLFQKIGNTSGMQKCDRILEAAFHSAETAPTIDEQQLKATVSIIDSMAFALIPVRKLGQKWESQTQLKPFTESEFKQGEKLKRRAAAIIDRLPAQNHQRRMVHRDLALWYTQLGKKESAEKEKQVLFQLVGFKDDSLLFPTPGACGHLSWWEKTKPKFQGACGMG